MSKHGSAPGTRHPIDCQGQFFDSLATSASDPLRVFETLFYLSLITNPERSETAGNTSAVGGVGRIAYNLDLAMLPDVT